MEFSHSLNEIEKELETHNYNILQDKKFIYPISTTALIVILVTIIGLTVYVKKRKQNTQM
jgi:hypothetical protein